MANLGGTAVTVYACREQPATSALNKRTLKGKLTKMATPAGIALDASGDVYVANSSSNSITVYGPKSKGNAKPIRTIAGPDTGLAGLESGIAVR